MKHLLKWVIPTVVLLLVGMWIGLNWDNFPANEQVFIPVVKKNEVKYDTTVNSSVESDTAITSTVATDQVSDAAADSLLAVEDEPIIEDEIIVEQEEAPVAEPEVIVAASPKKRIVSRIQNAAPENGSGRNQNATPSMMKVAQKKPVEKQVPKEVVAPKNEIVYDSYMSKKEIPVDNLVRVEGTYKPAASGKGVGEATFIVSNRTGKNLKKVNMEVHYLGEGDQLIDKKQMPVTNIAADGSVNVKLPANAEANRLVYKVLYVSSALGDFYYEPLPVYASALR